MLKRVFLFIFIYFLSSGWSSINSLYSRKTQRKASNLQEFEFSVDGWIETFLSFSRILNLFPVCSNSLLDFLSLLDLNVLFLFRGIPAESGSRKHRLCLSFPPKRFHVSAGGAERHRRPLEDLDHVMLKLWHHQIGFLRRVQTPSARSRTETRWWSQWTSRVGEITQTVRPTDRRHEFNYF